jgi:uncharacterized protein
MKMPDYQEISCQCAKIDINPSEAHGILTAFILGDEKLQFASWINEIKPDGLKIEQMDKTLLQGLGIIHLLTLKNMLNDDFIFVLYLPPFKDSLKNRVAALKLWCDGFAFSIGIVLSQKKISLSPEVNEFLKDIMQICNLKEESEENYDEDSFMQICEYIKIGIGLLQIDLKKI